MPLRAVDLELKLEAARFQLFNVGHAFNLHSDPEARPSSPDRILLISRSRPEHSGVRWGWGSTNYAGQGRLEQSDKGPEGARAEVRSISDLGPMFRNNANDVLRIRGVRHSLANDYA